MVSKDRFIKEYESGKSIAEMANVFKCSKPTIISYAKKLGLSRGKGNRTNHNRVFKF